MTSKLTLSIQDEIIRNAKEYAKFQGRSLSNIVEEYLKSIGKKKKSEATNNFSPEIEELFGSISVDSERINDKELLEDALIKKYLK